MDSTITKVEGVTIKDKVLAAILDMKTKIERDSKHIYRNPITGEMYQGVSTVSSIYPKDWLAAWGAKECAKALGYSDYTDRTLATEIWQKIKDCKSVDDYVAILKEAKGAHARKSKKAMVDGKAGHLWLESHVKARISGQEWLAVPSTLLQRPINQFLEWEKQNVDYWIASEAYVVNPQYRYAGQLDGIFISKTGKLSLVDFKFASSVSEDYHLQCAGYAACFEPYGILFDERVIIRLPKTLVKDQWNDKKYKYEEVPNDIQPYIVWTPYIGDREAFYAALIVKKWINFVERK